MVGRNATKGRGDGGGGACVVEEGEKGRGGGGSSGDLPQQHTVNQSDLDRTGTHLVTAPANTAVAGKRKRVRDLHFIGV